MTPSSLAGARRSGARTSPPRRSRARRSPGRPRPRRSAGAAAAAPGRRRTRRAARLELRLRAEHGVLPADPVRARARLAVRDPPQPVAEHSRHAAEHLLGAAQRDAAHQVRTDRPVEHAVLLACDPGCRAPRKSNAEASGYPLPDRAGESATPNQKERHLTAETTDITLRFPSDEDAAASQDTEWCEVVTDGERAHDPLPRLPRDLRHPRALRAHLPRSSGVQLARGSDRAPRRSSSSRPVRIPADLSVLDVGAGNGLVGEELQRLGVSALVGVDIIPEAARGRRARPPRRLRGLRGLRPHAARRRRSRARRRRPRRTA